LFFGNFTLSNQYTLIVIILRRNIVQSKKNQKQESSNEVLILEGVFFIRVDAIKNQAHIAQEALKEMKTFISKN
jgi:hypothetical protein